MIAARIEKNYNTLHTATKNDKEPKLIYLNNEKIVVLASERT